MPHVADKTISDLLTGGNHLTSALIAWLGAGPRNFSPHTTPPERALAIIGDINRFDAWMAWLAIMQFRPSWRRASE
jgi:hypothetical protein